VAKRLVVLISGNGSNLQALIDQQGADYQIVGVVSNKAGAYGLTRAQQANIPTQSLSLKAFKDAGKTRLDYDLAIAEMIQSYQPDLVVLAGWMLIVSPEFIDALGGKIINLHPALPDQFAGAHAIEDAFKAYQRGEITFTGCMVHYVIPEIDAGPVIAQARVPILPDDTLEKLEARMHQTEHQLIVHATKLALRDID
jgi:formyltetrahydrofolate-dependent phosphoribosylglycinamide formyltransferase